MRYRATWLAHYHLYHELEADTPEQAEALATPVDPSKLESFLVDLELVDVSPVSELPVREVAMSRELLELLRSMSSAAMDAEDENDKLQELLADFLRRTAD